MIEELKKIIKSRQFFLNILVLIITTVILLKLFNLQIVNGRVLDYYASRGSYGMRTIEAPRGKIYDRNGKLIAYNRTGYNVMVIRTGNIKEKDRPELYHELLKIFEKNGDTIDNLLSVYLTEDIEFTDLIKDETDEAAVKLKETWITKLINTVYTKNLSEEELKELGTPRKIFDYLRYKIMGINESYSDKEAYYIAAIMYTIVWNGNISITEPKKIATDVSQETMVEIEARHLELPGVYTEEIYFRQYNDPQLIAQLLGYVRAMSGEEYANLYSNKKVYGEGFAGNNIEALIEGKKVITQIDGDGKWNVDIPEGTTLKDGDIIKTTERTTGGKVISSGNIVFKTYSPNDIVGKSGIEKAAERTLKGEKGSKIIYVDKNGREIEEVYKKEAKAGDDVYLTIDLDLQKAARDSIIRNIEKVKEAKDYVEGGTEEQNKNARNFGDCVAGAVVAMEIETGELLASVSYPDFNPNIFLAPSSDKLAQQAIEALYSEMKDGKKNEETPSVNRVTQGLYAPGSVFKPIVALAALQEQKITKNTTYDCQRTWNYKLTCLAYHNHLSIVPSISKSCNVFFYEAGVALGINTIDKYAEWFGLGIKSGIEIPELLGKRSNQETMKEKEIDLQHVWSDADTAQTSIGQLYCQFTPVQLVRYTAALGTQGIMPLTHIIQKTVSYTGETKNTQPVQIQISGVSSTNYNIVKEGMIGVTDSADASIRPYFKKFFDVGITVAGKTGTPETGLEKLKKSSNGVFICYAPADNPKIAVAVVLEHGVWGSNAAPIAADVLAKYFGLEDEDEISYTVDIATPGVLP